MASFIAILPKLKAHLLVRIQNVPTDDDEYKRKLEEQKKIREKIKAIKEKKRQEAAESRRKDLLKRLAEEGKLARLL